jgi:hypothetical protein
VRREPPVNRDVRRHRRGEHHDRSSGVRGRLAGWTRRLPTLVPPQAVDEPAASTLATFFAGVRWSEEVGAGGERILRRAAM